MFSFIWIATKIIFAERKLDRGKKAWRERTVQARIVFFNIQYFDLAVNNVGAVAFAANAAKYTKFNIKAKSLRKICIWISKNANFSSSASLFLPSSGNKRIIHGKANNVINSLLLVLLSICDITRKMGLGASGSESTYGRLREYM